MDTRRRLLVRRVLISIEYGIPGRNSATRIQHPGVLRAALFDIDGTLVDTTALIREAVTQVLQEDGITPTWAEIKAGWALTAADRMQMWVRDRARAEILADRYLDRYLALHDQMVRRYPGIAETLAALAAHGAAVGVVTSKRRVSALRTLGAFDLQRYFPVIICEDDVRAPKPDPEPLLLAARRLAVVPAETVMIGDGAVDVQAGAAAGMHTAGALWGAVDPDALRAAHPTWLLGAPPELIPLFAH